MYSLRHYKIILNPDACIERFTTLPLLLINPFKNMSMSPNSLVNNVNNGAANGNGKSITLNVSFTPATIKALKKYKELKGFLREPETIRFIVNAVLVKEGLLQP